MDSDCLKLKYSFKKKVFTEFLLPIEDYWLENNSQTFIHGKFSTGKTKREVLEIFSFYMLIYPTFHAYLSYLWFKDRKFLLKTSIKMTPLFKWFWGDIICKDSRITTTLIWFSPSFGSLHLRYALALKWMCKLFLYRKYPSVVMETRCLIIKLVL